MSVEITLNSYFILKYITWYKPINTIEAFYNLKPPCKIVVNPKGWTTTGGGYIIKHSLFI